VWLANHNPVSKDFSIPKEQELFSNFYRTTIPPNRILQNGLISTEVGAQLNIDGIIQDSLL